MPNLVGQTLGPYALISLLGKGGMATVYRARQTLAGRVQREVAVKVIESELALNQEFVARFEREAQTIISLSHAHILKVFDYGQQGEMLYLVMELLSGGSLADRIRAGTLTWEDASRILDQIADAFDYAHSKGIIHRDLKPQNVLLDEAGNAYLSDFGIAKLLDETTGLTQSGTAMGTPAYMAPEQWQGGKIDALSDVYSLGVMLYEMVNGQVPFQGDTPFRVMYQHLYERPPSVRSLRPDLPPGLDQVFERALAKSPTERYQSASALAADFKSTALAMPTDDRTAPVPALGSTFDRAPDVRRRAAASGENERRAGHRADRGHRGHCADPDPRLRGQGRLRRSGCDRDERCPACPGRNRVGHEHRHARPGHRHTDRCAGNARGAGDCQRDAVPDTDRAAAHSHVNRHKRTANRHLHRQRDGHGDAQCHVDQYADVRAAHTYRDAELHGGATHQHVHAHGHRHFHTQRDCHSDAERHADEHANAIAHGNARAGRGANRCAKHRCRCTSRPGVS